MKTKIVYVVVSNKDSIYLAQAYASAWSLKYYNPDASITLVMDNKTSAVWDNCGFDEFKSLVDDIVAIDFEDSVGNHERSRFLKTSLRNIVKGDFLFVDTDTIITDSISELDDVKCDVGMVGDSHRYIEETPVFPFIIKWMKKYFKDSTISPTINYFNSGVMLVKDTEQAYNLFEKWHECWMHSSAQGFNKDQLPLFAADNALGGIIKPIKDVYNYQIVTTVKFICDARITHFFNGESNTGAIHPFFNDVFFQDIKKQKSLSDKQKNMIINCKSLYNINSRIIAGRDVDLWNSHAFKFLRGINGTTLYKLINFSSRCFNWGMRIVKGQK